MDNIGPISWTREPPYLDCSVSSSSDQLSFIQEDLLKLALMASLILVLTQFTLDQISVPKEHVTPFRTGEHFTVRQLNVAWRGRVLGVVVEGGMGAEGVKSVGKRDNKRNVVRAYLPHH